MKQIVNSPTASVKAKLKEAVKNIQDAIGHLLQADRMNSMLTTRHGGSSFTKRLVTLIIEQTNLVGVQGLDIEGSPSVWHF